eukprot:291012-Hanusia_phi.AAC.1
MQGLRGREHMRARATEIRMQGLRGQQHMRAQAQEIAMQGLRGREHMRAWAGKIRMQGLRGGSIWEHGQIRFIAFLCVMPLANAATTVSEDSRPDNFEIQTSYEINPPLDFHQHEAYTLESEERPSHAQGPGAGSGGGARVTVASGVSNY